MTVDDRGRTDRVLVVTVQVVSPRNHDLQLGERWVDGKLIRKGRDVSGEARWAQVISFVNIVNIVNIEYREYREYREKHGVMLTRFHRRTSTEKNGWWEVGVWEF